jgi:hypothetical protein
MFLAIHVATLVTITIWKSFNALTVLHVIFPVSLVYGSIFFCGYAKSMSLVILPVALIDISVSMDQSPLPVGFVVFIPPLIEGAIRPDLGATSLSDLSVNDPIIANKKIKKGIPLSMISRPVL